MSDIGSDFDGPMTCAPDPGPRHMTDARPRRLVAEVDTDTYPPSTIVYLYRDYGGGRLQPVSWPDDWPLDITLDQMRDRGVEVRE